MAPPSSPSTAAVGGLHEGRPPAKRTKTEGQGGLIPTFGTEGREGYHEEQGPAHGPPAAGVREGQATVPTLQHSNGTSPVGGTSVLAGDSGPASASALLGRTTTATAPFELLAALQPVLEGAGVDPDLLSAFEVAFARLGAPMQRVLARAVPRAVEFGGRAATEQLLRDALQGSGCSRPCL